MSDQDRRCGPVGTATASPAAPGAGGGVADVPSARRVETARDERERLSAAGKAKRLAVNMAFIYGGKEAAAIEASTS
jgi:hypothetical protein